MSYKNRKPKNIDTVLTVRDEECRGDADRMVRKFIKLSKKEGIVEEYRSRSHYIKPSVKKANDRRERQRTIDKVNRQREQLFSLRGSTSTRKWNRR
jgi:ribosomal protein S21